MQVLNSYSELVKASKASNEKLITIDGRDGSGKTYVAKYLSAELGATLLTEESYRYATLEGLFRVHKTKLYRDMVAAMVNGLVVYESCLMMDTLKRLGLNWGYHIYIKHINPHTGEWEEFHELAEEPTKKMALDKELGAVQGMMPSNFRLQMIEYHYDYLPHEKSDAIFKNVH